MRRFALVFPLPVLAFGLLTACKDDDVATGGEAATSEGATTDGGSGTGDPGGPGTQGTEDPTTGGSDSDGTGTGTTTTGTSEGTTDGPPVVPWSFGHVFGRANQDDDDDNGNEDWFDPRFDGDNELTRLVLPGETLASLPPGTRVRLTLAGAADRVRAYIGSEVVLGSSPPILEHTFVAQSTDVAIDWEFAGHNVEAELTIAWLDAQDAPRESFVAAVRSSPLITNHHLQPAEHAWVVDVAGGQGYNNQSMVQAIQSVLGDRLTRVPANDYDWDVWIQDEFEWATARAADGGRLDVVIDSIRNRGLDPMPEDSLVGPDYIAQTWGTPPKTTYDSFGNLDASPPVTVDGAFYPFGRIYYGLYNGEGIDQDFADFLGSQEIQKPFAVDTTWLCVGHVDEFSTILPDPSAPKGFRLLLSSVPAMYEILDALPGGTQLPRYAQDYGYSSIGEIVGDFGLRAYNEDIQADHLDPIRATFKKELGLDDADIVEVPTIFERVNNCGAVALIPGTVNLFLFNVEGEPPHAFVPDPFLRSGGVGQDSDPIIADFKSRMPKDIVLHFVDNWNVYHTSLGEVHCGTNVQRTPLANWWEE